MKRVSALLGLIFVFSAFAAAIHAQPSIFTYQGKLTDQGSAANGTYQMQFAIYGSELEGGPGNATITNDTVLVVNGIFTVQLDFGATEFTNSTARWLEVRVKRPADPLPYIVLTPRQQITSSPFSLHAARANGANFLTDDCDECVTDAHMASVASSKIIGTMTDSQVADNLTINGGTINNTVIGGTTPATGTFVALTATSGLRLNDGAATDAIITETTLQRESAANETFSFRNPGAGTLRVLVDNTASATEPSYAFTTDPDTGIFSSGANVLDFSTGGITRAQMNNTGLSISGTIAAGGGTLTGPLTINTTPQTDTHFGETAINRNSATNETFRFENTGAGLLQLQVDGFGNAGAPSYSFINDQDTGLYSAFNGQMNVSVDGTSRMFVNGFGVTVEDDLTIFGNLASVGSNTTFQLRRPNHTTGAGTQFSIIGQTAAAGNNSGGNVQVIAGNSTGSANGGDVIISGGLAPGTGSAGRILIGTGTDSAREINIGNSATNEISTSRSITGSVANLRTETTDLTPDVANLTVLRLAYGTTFNTITDLTGGVEGQCVALVASTASVSAPWIGIASGGNFRLAKSDFWSGSPTNTLTLCRVEGLWIETARSNN